MKVILATGGTGGHIYPAVALADEIIKQDKNSEILFVGSKTRMESKEIPQAGYRFYPLDIVSSSGSIFNKAASILSMFSCTVECIKLMKQQKPDVVIGFGNYISMPVILAAHQQKILTVLHEQNSYAGKANRFLSRYADAIVGCYKENLEQFPHDKTRILGNPRATMAASSVKDETVIRELGLDTNKKLVVIVMGSLGSESVNSVMKNALNQMKNKDYQLLYVTGRNHYNEFTQNWQPAANIKIVPYIDGCKVMTNADLCVVRGGATTAAEMTAMEMPCIIIPSPYVPNNHQVKNALALQNEGAAVMIEEKDLTEQVIINKIEEILYNHNRLEMMAKAAGKLAKKNASKDILSWINELKDEKK